MSDQAVHPVPELEPVDPVYLLRDQLAGHFVPMTPYERRLLTRYAVTMERYDGALAMERRAFDKTDPLEMLEKAPERFKTISRYVAECERTNRRALEELRRIIRERKKTLASPNARKPWNRLEGQKLPPGPAPVNWFDKVLSIKFERRNE